jgi:hypothetical protein
MLVLVVTYMLYNSSKKFKVLWRKETEKKLKESLARSAQDMTP